MNKVFLRLKRNDTAYIECIKELRHAFGLGLKEAKDFVDLARAGRAICIHFWGDPNDVVATNQGLNAHFIYDFNSEPYESDARRSHRVSRDRELYTQMGSGKIQAIKDLRYALGWGLKESKEFMDEMWGYEHSPKQEFLDIDLTEYQAQMLREYGFIVQSNVTFEFTKEEEGLFTI